MTALAGSASTLATFNSLAAAERGRDLLRGKGHDYDRVIRPIRGDGSTDLPNGFFHFVFNLVEKLFYVLLNIIICETYNFELYSI